jgi:hypothetical protein
MSASASLSAVLLHRQDGASPRTGWIAGRRGGHLVVDFPSNARGPIEARTTLVLSSAEMDRAVAERRSALLLFENGDLGLPIVVGLLEESTPGRLLREVLEGPQPVQPTEARVDGRRVVLEGEHEVVLRCGKASLTLRQDGRVVLRGVNVTAEASAIHRIRGGKVQIN